MAKTPKAKNAAPADPKADKAFCGFHCAAAKYEAFRATLANEGRDAATILRLFIEAYTVGRVTFGQLKGES